MSLKAQRAKWRYCECGRRILVSVKGSRLKQAKHHDMCRKCWYAQRDRERLTCAAA